MEDNLSPAAITENLNTHFIGHKVIYYPSLPSTNESARKEAQWGAAAGTVVVADEQTAGRGRLSRTWLSPKGSVALSVILRPNIAYLPGLIMLASLAVVRAIDKTTGLKAEIKWPNDVLIKGKKVCGILIENEVRRNTLAYAIIGIGINVNIHLADFEDIFPIATSLSDEMSKAVSRLEVVRQLLMQMDKLYLDLPNEDIIYEQWRNNMVMLGKRVRAQSGESVIEGLAESVGKDGSLYVRLQDGILSRIVAGDATILRR